MVTQFLELVRNSRLMTARRVQTGLFTTVIVSLKLTFSSFNRFYISTLANKHY